MEKKNNILLISLIVMVVINIVTISSIWLRPGKERIEDVRIERVILNDPPPGGDRLAEMIGFRREQAEKFEELKRAHHREAGRILHELKQKKQDLILKVTKEPANHEEVIKSAEEIGTKQKELELLTFNHFKDIRELCDEGQKKRFDEVIVDLREVIR